MFKASLAVLILAQVGLIITSNEPERAEKLLMRAKDVVRQVRAATARAELSATDKAKVEHTAHELFAAAKTIQSDAKRGISMSLGEQDQMDKALAGVRRICEYLVKRVVRGEKPEARTAPIGVPTPAPAPSPRPAASPSPKPR